LKVTKKSFEGKETKGSNQVAAFFEERSLGKENMANPKRLLSLKKEEGKLFEEGGQA